jgi:hypothetical protein
MYGYDSQNVKDDIPSVSMASKVPDIRIGHTGDGRAWS